MPLDALCLQGLTAELAPLLAGARVDKVRQPSRDEVILALRGSGGAMRLLLTANPACPRLQLTGENPENPAAPPMFCMLLRKHLSGGRIVSLTQPPLERVAVLELEVRDELGEAGRRSLILEAIGRQANLILTDGEGRILDCLRRVEGDLPARRALLPGLFYRLPPAPARRSLLDADQAELEALLAAAPGEREAAGWLVETFGGLSPLAARELVFRACGQTDARLPVPGLAGQLAALARRAAAGDFAPTLLVRDGAPFDFSFLPILQYGPQVECQTRPDFSALLDEFYARREGAERMRQKGQELTRTVTSLRNRVQRRLASQSRELADTQGRERLRELGDLITSNLHRMERGSDRLTAQDYYDPDGRETEIPLNPLLTPQQNAAKYYKDYNRAKAARHHLTLQLERGRAELAYLESVLEAIRRAEGEQDLQEIRQELADEGLLRAGGKAAQRRRVTTQPLAFQSSAGLDISVGRNNVQNDRLTTKQAGPRDYWFHAQHIHGAHVILWTQGREPDEASILQAAALAAYYSQGRESGRVLVDYAPVKQVKKPAGARPGMVVYKGCRTVAAAPDPALVEQLRKKQGRPPKKDCFPSMQTEGFQVK